MQDLHSVIVAQRLANHIFRSADVPLTGDPARQPNVVQRFLDTAFGLGTVTIIAIAVFFFALVLPQIPWGT